MPVRISAIISDYDGTLCPTVSAKSKENTIPQDLQNILWKISEKIPICILSSKDFGFLRDKVQFAKIVACIIGIEIFDFRRSNQSHAPKSKPIQTMPENPVTRHLLSNVDKLLENSIKLNELSSMILNEFQEVKVEHKFTYIDRILAALSIDYRHIQKWEQFKANIEPELRKAVLKFKDSRLPNDLYIQTYSDHPFLDVYALKYEKGIVMESIIQSLNLGERGRVLYLGDSENDNSAFLKADLSIGIQSDTRIKTKLDSDYIIEFNELRPFLQKLASEDFVFDRMSQNIS